MTVPPAVTSNTANFYDPWLPILTAGLNTLTATFTFKDNTGAIPEDLPKATQSVFVNGLHYSLPTSGILTCFPPANGSGAYGQYLPMVVLGQPSLPWLRNPGSATPQPPWLALLLLAPDEITAPVGATLANNPTLVGTATVAEVVSTATLTGYLQPTFAILQAIEDGAAPCEYVDLPLSTFTAVLPSLADLRLMAHARNVSVTTTVAGTGANGVPVGVLIGNRLPASQTPMIVHLVSLEGFTDYLTGGSASAPASTTTVRLVSLASWTFQSNPGVDFAARVSALDVDVLRLPTAPVASPTDAQIHALAALDSGYVPLNETQSQGERTVSWYRGPLAPTMVAEAARARACYSASGVTIYDSTTGMFDQSYATAWQIGRLLALSNADFVQQVLGLRQSLVRSVTQTMNWQQSLATFGGMLSVSPPGGGAPAPAPGALAAAATQFFTQHVAPTLTGEAVDGKPLIGAARDPHRLLSRRARNRS